MKLSRIPMLTVMVSSPLGLALGCEKQAEPPLQPAAYVAPRLTAADAANSVARARCDYARRCGEIGETDSHFQSYEQCGNAMKSDVDRKFSECQNGVGSEELKKCLTEISNEDCGGITGVFDSIDRRMTCSASALCLD